MKTVYEFQDYREFLSSWISSQEHSRGLRGRLSEAMGISSTMMSLIMKGDKNLSLEQAAEAAEFVGLNEKETDYFFLLVELGRAGSHKLQTKLRRQIRAIQSEANKIAHRVKKDIELSEEAKAVFYSSWLYSGVRILSAVDGFNDIPSIAKRFNLPMHVVANVVEFLLEKDLCRKENGKITYGAARTHVGADSPFVTKHHHNWRLRGLQMMEQANETNLFYTKNMAISHKAAEEIRKLLPPLIESVDKIGGPSESEKVYCLNLDWFEY